VRRSGAYEPPQVAAPVAVVNGTGDIPSAGGGFCRILAQLYPTHEVFVEKWDQAVASDVSKGYLLPADGAVLDKVA